MKNWLHKLLVGLVCCIFLVCGWQNRALAVEVTQNVYDYLLQYQPETYNLLKQELAESIEDAKQLHAWLGVVLNGNKLMATRNLPCKN